MSDELIESLGKAVEAAPEDAHLRTHLARLLLAADRGPEAVAHCAAVLARDPGNAQVQELMSRALTPRAPAGPGGPTQAGPGGPTQAAQGGPTQAAPAGGQQHPDPFNWRQAEAELSDGAQPMFVDSTPDRSEVPDPDRPDITLADVGGLDEVKDRINATFLAPMRNPELRAMYGLSLRGGMLMYGPPGCGKTFLAKAIAGELGATFIHVAISDVLDMFIGNSERNLHEVFESARANAPCVLFFDEIDALGQKRSLTRGRSADRTINQLLTEMDGAVSNNEGVYVLGATNAPWDVDPALRRPGRFDRTVLVTPPDRAAREVIFRTHLRDKPIEGVDLATLAKITEGHSGADIALACRDALEVALVDSVRSGQARLIGMRDVEHAVRKVRPSIGPWVEVANNVVLYGNSSGEYDELAGFLRRWTKRR